MKPNKEGQIVKFHTPFPDEDPNQLYVVIELKIDGYRDRADIKPLGKGLGIQVINTVFLDDLEVVEVETNDLIGHFVTIKKSDNTEVVGNVVKAKDHKIFLDLNKHDGYVETNVHLTVIDVDGFEHIGTLVVR